MRAVLIFIALTASAAERPPMEPQVQGVFPRGLERGRTVTMALRGRNLQALSRVVFSARGLTGEVLDSSAYGATLRVTASAGAEPGRHDLRLVAPHGSTLTWIDVSTFRESIEQEPNSEPAKARKLVFPALVNGVITAADYDYFAFEAQAKQTLSFELLATRNGSSLDGVLEILDAEGRVLDYCDDYYAFKDPRLLHTFAKTGAYLLRVYGSGESGSENGGYRLIAGAMPHADFALPAGGQPGTEVTFDIKGVNLSGVSAVTLGDGIAEGEVLHTTAESARIRMKIPAGAKPGDTALHIQGAALPVPFVISTTPEFTALPGAARKRHDPLPVPLGTTVNGVIDAGRAADYFSIRLERPEDIVLSVHSMNLGYLLDPLVAIYDEAGKRLAWQDDPTTNTGKEPANLDPHLTFRLDKGRYTIAIRDSQFRGDASYLYRLTVKRAEPDFTVRVVGAHHTLYRNQPNVVHVRVRRLEGWNTPVTVWAESLPPGVRVKPTVAEPKNTSYTGTCGERHYLDGTNVELEFQVDADAALDLTKIVFRARGERNGRTVNREASARYWKSRIRVAGDPEEPALFATVAELPGVVFQTPERATPGKITAIITRLDESDSPLRIEGEGVTPVTIAAGVTRADVELTKPGMVVLYGRAGQAVIGQSHPIRVEAKR
ncbi:MAG: hypothetical protein FJW30_24500 [Acidobacteria bacterium]|nr:hypothetical protein [Acidobacteriota bacterium]